MSVGSLLGFFTCAALVVLRTFAPLSCKGRATERGRPASAPLLPLCRRAKFRVDVAACLSALFLLAMGIVTGARAHDVASTAVWMPGNFPANNSHLDFVPAANAVCQSMYPSSGSFSGYAFGAGLHTIGFQCYVGNQWVSGGSVTHVHACVADHHYGEFHTCTEELPKDLGSPAYPCCQANPVNAATGNKTQIEPVYRAAAGPLDVTLQYNSRTKGNVFYDGPFTNKWSWRYGVRIREQNPGLLVVVQRPDGREFRFTAPASGNIFVGDADVADRLERQTNASGATTGWHYRVQANDEVEQFDAAGKLLLIRNRHGLDEVMTYNGAGHLSAVTDPFGRQLTLIYNTDNRVEKITDPAAGEHLIEYTGTMLTKVTFPGGAFRTYHYNEPEQINGGTACSGLPSGLPGHLTGLTDENGDRFATWSYDCEGRVTGSTHALGANQHGFTYSTGSSEVTDALGTSRTISTSRILDVTRGTGTVQPAESGGTVSEVLTHDANGNVSSRTDWNGNRTNYGYDLTRNLETSRTEGLTSAGSSTPQTRTITTIWHSTFRLPTQIVEPGRTTAFTHDANGNVLTKTVTAGSASRVWTYTYNANGSVLTVDGPRTDVSDVTTYTYYGNAATCPGASPIGCRGQVETITNAVGHVTQITEYNAHGQPLTIVDPNSLTTTLAYDARQRLASRTVGAEITSYNYDDVGQLTRVTLPDGSFLAYTYDNAHRLTRIEDNLANQIVYMLDAMGNRTLEQVRDPLGALAQTRSRVFSNLNRLAQEIGAAGQTATYGYDNHGNLTSIDGPLAGAVDVTTNAYDALNRRFRVTDPNSGQVNYGYDALDQLTSVSDPRSLVTSYSIDGLGNLNQQVSPDTGTTTNTYDAAGNLLTQTDAKTQLTSYAYDALNRVTSITYQGGVVHSYQYDQGVNGKGRLTQITEPNSTTQYAYDQKGRLVTETRTINAVAHVTSYGYDASGRLNSMTYPSGRQLTYVFDALGRIQQIDTHLGGVSEMVVGSVTYQPFGPAKTFMFGNALTYARGFDQDGRISSYTLATQTFSVGFDAASRINLIAQDGNPTNFNTYSYDALDRLTQAILPAITHGYSYDGVGNRVTRTAGSSSHTYAYGGTSNRLSSITPNGGPVKTYVHDANGSVTADGTNTHSYDTRGRMTQAVSAIGTTSYQLNSLGQRIRKTNTLGDTVYHYDREGRLIAESSPGGTVQKEYIYLGDIPVAVIQ